MLLNQYIKHLSLNSQDKYFKLVDSYLNGFMKIESPLKYPDLDYEQIKVLYFATLSLKMGQLILADFDPYLIELLYQSHRRKYHVFSDLSITTINEQEIKIFPRTTLLDYLTIHFEKIGMIISLQENLRLNNSDWRVFTFKNVRVYEKI